MASTLSLFALVLLFATFCGPALCSRAFDADVNDLLGIKSRMTSYMGLEGGRSIAATTVRKRKAAHVVVPRFFIPASYRFQNGGRGRINEEAKSAN